MTFKTKMKKKILLILWISYSVLAFSIWAFIRSRYFFGLCGIAFSITGILIYYKIKKAINSIEE